MSSVIDWQLLYIFVEIRPKWIWNEYHYHWHLNEWEESKQELSECLTVNIYIKRLVQNKYEIVNFAIIIIIIFIFITAKMAGRIKALAKWVLDSYSINIELHRENIVVNVINIIIIINIFFIIIIDT